MGGKEIKNVQQEVQEQMPIHAETQVPEPAGHAEESWTPADIITVIQIVAPVLVVFFGGYWGWKKIKISKVNKKGPK